MVLTSAWFLLTMASWYNAIKWVFVLNVPIATNDSLKSIILGGHSTSLNISTYN